MKSSATGSTVSNVTYSVCIGYEFCGFYVLTSFVFIQGNTATGLRQFGILIDQSYPDTLGTPGTGVILSVSTNLPMGLFSRKGKY